MGRKDLYAEQVAPRLEEIKEWIGITGEKEIAKKLGISSSTFEKYKKDHPELRDALKKGREALVEDLKVSLKKKAKGFSYSEKKTVTKAVFTRPAIIIYLLVLISRIIIDIVTSNS